MDALGTAIVMGLDDIVEDILVYIQTIDFGTTATEISLFETTIRYLGGMLSGATPSLPLTLPEVVKAWRGLTLASVRPPK
ncbi:glycoside hydrolase family 47 protein [Candidatus Bathyarchaeota archaeon]|nr:glycoside hydrolase family 47 protein [Candidatus Bathyarchaeota archaeon]